MPSPAPLSSVRTAVPIRWGFIAILSIAYLAMVGAQTSLMSATGYEAFVTDGPSMEPTLVDADRFIVDKGAYGVTLPLAAEQSEHWADPTPGDVVVIRSPADDIDIVKRVIGIAGDRIAIRDGAVHRNGTPIARGAPTPCGMEEHEEIVCIEEEIGARRWITSASPLTSPESMDELIVPAGTVFVLGDHRDRSNDSRNPRIGAVPVERLRGRAIAIYWSRVAGRTGTWIE